MKKVNVTTLKAQLSKYLRLVRSGTDLLVLDRNLPIARVSRLPEPDESARQGIAITPATKNLAEIEVSLPALPLSAGGSDSLAVLLEDRAR